MTRLLLSGPSDLMMTLSLQKMEAGALGDWLLGTAPVTSAPIGYQSSKKPEDWLVSQKESQVRQM